ncbi:MAG TPA: SBBP repeat-containing protein, partial [Thermoanaerobaculia bacterium]|nr:SBBP repeat-containing protein [Thermoanaerobaculia bacterium]
GSGNVYVAGWSRGATGATNYVTVAYDPGGNQLWVREHNGTGDGDDYARAMAIDGNGGIYVTGESQGAPGGLNYATVKYDTAGDLLWAVEYGGPGDGDDVAHSLAVDGSGNVYVTGESLGATGRIDLATIKYDGDGHEQWAAVFDGPLSGPDRTSRVLIDPAGRAIVAATQVAPDGTDDFLAIRYAEGGGPPFCTPSATTACLQDGRFEVTVEYRTQTGSGPGQVMEFAGARTENTDSVFYWFFTPTNYEMGLKVLDACVPALGNRYWVFVSGLTDQGWRVTVRDTATGLTRDYTNELGVLSRTFADTETFGCATGGASGPLGEAGAIGPGARALGVALADLWAAEAAAARAARAEASGVEAGTCERTATTGCLQNGRFEVRSAYQTGTGGGEAQVMSFGGQRAENVDSVFYTFFTPTNFEMGLKVLDACIPSLGNNFWVFGSGLTDQGWTVTVRDTVAGGERTYTNPVGSLSQTFLDATAFPCD